ncbi:MAG: hypothetical protein U0136_15735 [Bdellovibrionota bacterium]
MRFDTFVAALFLLAASIVSISAYRAMNVIERPRGSLLQSLPVGDTQYALFAGSQCLGTLSLAFRREQQTTLVSNGEYTFSYQGKQLPVKTFFGAYFNVLEQLVACNASVEGEGFRFDAKMINPSPMKIDLQLTMLGKSFARHISLPGPVMLRKNRDDTYRVEYVFAEKFNPGTLLPGTLQVPVGPSELANLAISVTPFDQKPGACEFGSDGAQPMSLDTIAERAKELIPKFQTLGGF